MVVWCDGGVVIIIAEGVTQAIQLPTWWGMFGDGSTEGAVVLVGNDRLCILLIHHPITRAMHPPVMALLMLWCCCNFVGGGGIVVLLLLIVLVVL